MKPNSAQPHTDLGRRRLLQGSAVVLAVPLAACVNPLPLQRRSEPAEPGVRLVAPSAQANSLLSACAAEHGLSAFKAMNDVNLRYGGQWRPLINRVQPRVVDESFRGPSEERLLPRLGLLAQAYRGPAGSKQVLWQRTPNAPAQDRIEVSYNGVQTREEAATHAAALVADCYGLFLLGALWLAERGSAARLLEPETLRGRRCHRIEMELRPGFGFSEFDRVVAWIDDSKGVLMRVRFTLEGVSTTRGAVAQTDLLEHQRLHGVLWPVVSREDVVHPLRLPAHDWYLDGLDVDRGLQADDLRLEAWSARARAVARGRNRAQASGG